MTPAPLPVRGQRLRVAVFVSGQGRGTNLQAILDACEDPAFPAIVALAVGTRSDSPAMDRARAAGIPAAVISPRRFESDDDYGQALLDRVRSADVELICLAGYLRVLPKCLVSEFRHRILNVHPALLPLFGGKGMYGHHVQEAVLQSGMKVAGCTVHIVDEEYDTGPIVVQRCVPVLDDDTPESLAARILPEEHCGYVDAIRLFAEASIEVDGRRVHRQRRDPD